MDEFDKTANIPDTSEPDRGDTQVPSEDETIVPSTSPPTGSSLFETSNDAPAPIEMPSDGIERIGGYRLIRKLGEGGMGVVYLAEQSNPRRTVALKVIRPGFATGEVLRRFEFEAQLLGRLQHPGIAQVYEAGTADTGAGPQPFFAMELVEGRPLVSHADAEKLSIRERLELFMRVCEAVQHAHSKGVIHRDLKPANILVGADGQPKVLDFGVARATDSDVQQVTIQTHAGQLVGTLPYMSPEQLDADPNELDTRSDVYTLGVILYELLARKLPHDLSNKTITQAIQTLGDSSAAGLSSIDKRLGGDVQTIVEHAMERDRGRRYQTAADLSSDIERYLTDEPIIARPPSTVYQLRKFAKRNKALVAGAAIGVAALIAGVIVSTALMIRAQEAEAVAEQEREIALEARNEAKIEARRATAVSDFLTEELLGSANPAVSQGREISVGEVLDRASERIGAGLDEDPRVELPIRSALGEIYQSLGDYQNAHRHFEWAANAASEAYGPQDPNTFAARRNVVLAMAEMGDLAGAEAVSLELVKDAEETFGANDALTAGASSDLGRIASELGKHEEAERRMREALVVLDKEIGPNGEEPITIRNNLATLMKAQGRFDEAEELNKDVLQTRLQMLGELHPLTLASYNNLATVLAAAGKIDEAEPYLRKALEGRMVVLGPEHPNTLNTQINLSHNLIRRGNYEEAIPLLEGVVEVQTRTLGADHPSTGVSMNNLGYAYEDAGRLEEAEAVYMKTLAARVSVLGSDHPDTIALKNNIASLLQRTGRLEEAEIMFAEAVGAARRTLGDDHIYTAIFRNNFGDLLLERGNLARAERELSESLGPIEGTFGPEHERTKRALERLARVYEAQGDQERAGEIRDRLASDDPARPGS